MTELFSDLVEEDFSFREVDHNIGKFRDALCASHIPYGHHGWAYISYFLNEFPICRDVVMEALPSSDTVIGYELSVPQLKLIEESGRKYVNVRTHPIRFLPDYHFAASTNCPEIHDRLVGLRIGRSHVEGQVRIIKARSARKHAEIDEPLESLTLFMQTSFDTSRMHEGFFLDDWFTIANLRRFRSVNNLTGDFLFRRHPHEPISPSVRAALFELGGIETELGSYELLSVPGMKVVSLSSSVCSEAQYFGAKQAIFHPEPTKYEIIGQAPKLGRYVMLPSNVSDGHFWDYVLGKADSFLPRYSYESAPFAVSSGISWGFK